MASHQSIRSNSYANRITQLTPLKNESSDKFKMGIPLNSGNSFGEEKKRKIDKLDPISSLSKDSIDTRKYFQQ